MSAHTHTLLKCLSLYVSLVLHSFFVFCFFFLSFFKTVVHPSSPACLRISFYLSPFCACLSLSISFPASLPYLFFCFFLRWCLLMETDLCGSEKYSLKPNIYPKAWPRCSPSLFLQIAVSNRTYSTITYVTYHLYSSSISVKLSSLDSVIWTL